MPPGCEAESRRTWQAAVLPSKVALPVPAGFPKTVFWLNAAPSLSSAVLPVKAEWRRRRNGCGRSRTGGRRRSGVRYSRSRALVQQSAATAGASTAAVPELIAAAAARPAVRSATADLFQSYSLDVIRPFIISGQESCRTVALPRRAGDNAMGCIGDR